jgi:hypothetical protein
MVDTGGANALPRRPFEPAFDASDDDHDAAGFDDFRLKIEHELGVT